MVDYIYKILRAKEWNQVLVTSSYTGSPDDIRDGFIHFSTRAQLEVTAAKYFSEELLIHITRYKCESFDPDLLRWEESRGGDLFPHLYGPFDIGSHTNHWQLTKLELGLFDFTTLPED